MASTREAASDPTEPGAIAPGDGERLQKILARAGIASRRRCDELISQGRVSVDGKVAVLGQRVASQFAVVEVDGVIVPVSKDLVHYLLNKPTGVISTSRDPHNRPSITALVPPEPRVFSIGRLDADSEGLIIMTNDGALAQAISHPSRGVEKEYLVSVSGTPSPASLKLLRSGVELEEGMTRPAKVGVLAPGLLRIVLHEGRNRQIRRACDVIGHPVTRLVRTRIGPIVDRNLEPGQWRYLTSKEVRSLFVASKVAWESASSHAGRDRTSAPPR